MSRCAVCRGRLGEQARTCPVCGEPLDAAAQTLATFTAQGPWPGDAQEPVDSESGTGPADAGEPEVGHRWVAGRRRRTVLAGGLVAAFVVATTAYLSLTGREDQAPNAMAYGIVKLSAQPAVRWKLPFDRVVPDLGCPTKPTGSEFDPLGLNSTPVDGCSATDAVVFGDTAVVSVQRKQDAELVGLSTVDGTVRWHRKAPAGSTHDCVARKGRLWCVTAPVQYLVAESVPSNNVLDPDSSATMSLNSQRSLKFASSVLTQIMPRTGAVLHSTPVPKSKTGAFVGGVGEDGVYVVAIDPEAETDTPPVQITRYTGDGSLAWSRQATAVRQTPVGASNFYNVSPVAVYEVRGRALVTGVEVAGQQAVFEMGTGEPAGREPGHIVAVTRDAVVTQRGSRALRVSGTNVADQLMAGLVATDRSAGEPVLTGGRNWAALDEQGNEDQGSPLSSDMRPIVIRSMPDPGRSEVVIKGDDEPLGFCAGVILSVNQDTNDDSSLTGTDPGNGRRKWSFPSTGGPTIQLRCAGSTVLVADDSRITGVDLKTGVKRWTAVLPAGSGLLGSGFGDVGEGVVTGPEPFAPVSASSQLSFLR